MKIVAARDLTFMEPRDDHRVVRVEVVLDELLERRAARIADATGLSANLVVNQALVNGLLLELLKTLG